MQEKVGEVFQKDRLTKDLRALDIFNSLLSVLNNLNEKHDSTNGQLREGMGDLRESKRSRNRLSDHATQYLLRWFEQHEQKEQLTQQVAIEINLNLQTSILSNIQVYEHSKATLRKSQILANLIKLTR